jgi:hypothetical protein
MQLRGSAFAFWHTTSSCIILLSAEAPLCDQEALHSTLARFQQRAAHILTLRSSQLPLLAPLPD